MENGFLGATGRRPRLILPAKGARMLSQMGSTDTECRIAHAIDTACLAGDYRARVRVTIDEVAAYQRALEQAGYKVEAQKSMWERQGIKYQYLYIEWAVL